MAARTAAGRLLTSLLAILWIASLSGCSITQLQHDELQEPEQLRTGSVNVEARATGFTGGRVGWGRITVFSIPVVPIRIHSDEASDLMDVVRDALTTAGYTATVADYQTDAPILNARVDEVRFNNYTWLAPLVPTWGRLHVTLTLETPGGQVLWEQSFQGKGTTFDFTDGYNKAAIKSVTRLANSMVEAFAAQEFANAISPDSQAAAISP